MREMEEARSTPALNQRTNRSPVSEQEEELEPLQMQSQIIVARLTPVLIIALFAYSAYVAIGQLSVDYLISPSANGYLVQPRVSAAIGIITVTVLLLVINLVVYVRIVAEIILKPDFVPLPSERKRPGREDDLERGTPLNDLGFRYEDTPTLADLPDFSAFYTQDVFVCGMDGMPICCNKCGAYKAARSHHDSRTDRCVYRLDHFCPWMGGCVSQSNYKFFLQSVVCMFLYCIWFIGLFGYFINEQRGSPQPTSGRLGTDGIDPQLIVILALAGLCGLFAFAMVAFTFFMVKINMTTVEDIARGTKVWTLAVRLKHTPAANAKLPFKVLAYPLIPAEGVRPRSFAILSSERGENPFDLGWMQNTRMIMGESVWEWFSPITKSPYHTRFHNEGLDQAYGEVLKKMIRRTEHTELFPTRLLK